MLEKQRINRIYNIGGILLLIGAVFFTAAIKSGWNDGDAAKWLLPVSGALFALGAIFIVIATIMGWVAKGEGK